MSKEQRQEVYELYDQILDGLESNYSSGELDENDYTRLKIKSLADLETSLIELTGLKESKISNNESNYSMNYANFNMKGYFVPALVECIEQDYETLEDGLADILEQTELTEQQLNKILSGKLFPRAEMVDILNEMFTTTSTNDENALRLQAFAAVDRGDLEESVLLELLDETEEDDEELEDEDENEEDSEEVEEDEETSDEPDAKYSYINDEVEQLKSKIANFEFNSQLQERISEVAQLANQGIQEHWLTKYKKDLYLGSVNKIEDMVASFSQNAESNGVDLETHLYAIEFALQADKEANDPSVDFSRYVEENLTPPNEEEDELIKINVASMKERLAARKSNR
jgi:hypothetical protein